jgi:hypothetical protein
VQIIDTWCASVVPRTRFAWFWLLSFAGLVGPWGDVWGCQTKKQRSQTSRFLPIMVLRMATLVSAYLSAIWRSTFCSLKWASDFLTWLGGFCHVAPSKFLRAEYKLNRTLWVPWFRGLEFLTWASLSHVPKSWSVSWAQLLSHLGFSSPTPSTPFSEFLLPKYDRNIFVSDLHRGDLGTGEIKIGLRGSG